MDEMYVARLPDGWYIQAIKDGRFSKCASRIRAAQFNRQKADQLKRLLQIEVVEATWERL